MILLVQGCTATGSISRGLSRHYDEATMAFWGLGIGVLLQLGWRIISGMKREIAKLKYDVDNPPLWAEGVDVSEWKRAIKSKEEVIGIIRIFGWIGVALIGFSVGVLLFGYG